MARRKISVAYIANDAVRRATFRKRRRGVLKKVEELATLCDVRACAVVYAEGEARAEAWPSENEARDMLRRFRDMPPSDQGKKMLDQEGFMRQRVSKQHEKLRRMLLNNQELQMTILMLEAMAGRSLHDLSVEDMSALGRFLEAKAKVLHDRIGTMRQQAAGATTTTAADPATTTVNLVKEQLPAAAQQIIEWAPDLVPTVGHDGPVAVDAAAWQRNEWGFDPVVPSEHNPQMFLGSGSGGLEELTQPYMNNNVDSTWLPYMNNIDATWASFYCNQL